DTDFVSHASASYVREESLTSAITNLHHHHHHHHHRLTSMWLCPHMCGLDGFQQSYLSIFHDFEHPPSSGQNSSYHSLCTPSKFSCRAPYSLYHPLSYLYMPKPNPSCLYVQHAQTTLIFHASPKRTPDQFPTMIQLLDLIFCP